MVSPFCCMYSIAAASIWWPVEVKGPVSGRISPIFNACWADATVPPVETVSATTMTHSAVGRFIRALLLCSYRLRRRCLRSRNLVFNDNHATTGHGGRNELMLVAHPNPAVHGAAQNKPHHELRPFAAERFHILFS